MYHVQEFLLLYLSDQIQGPSCLTCPLDFLMSEILAVLLHGVYEHNLSMILWWYIPTWIILTITVLSILTAENLLLLSLHITGCFSLTWCNDRLFYISPLSKYMVPYPPKVSSWVDFLVTVLQWMVINLLTLCARCPSLDADFKKKLLSKRCWA